MAENTPSTPELQAAISRLELQKKEALGKFLEFSLQITGDDAKIVRSVAQILGALANEVEKHPEDFLSSGTGDIQALIAALKTKAEGAPGVSGGDIVGGLSWSDIVDTIKALEGFLKDEKVFVMDILRLIFCGCKGEGW